MPPAGPPEAHAEVLCRRRRRRNSFTYSRQHLLRSTAHLPSCSSPANRLPRQGRRMPAPWFYTADAGSVTTVEICVSAAAKLRPATRARRSTSPRGLSCHRTDKAGNIYSAPLYIRRFVLLLLRKHRSAAGNGLGTSIKYQRRTTSAATGNGLGTTIKYLRRTTRQRPGQHDQLHETRNERRRGQRPRRHYQVPATHNERHRGQRPGHHGQVSATHNERRRGQRLKRHDQVPATHNERRRGQLPEPWCVWPVLMSR
jgi:hypothetical protein